MTISFDEQRAAPRWGDVAWYLFGVAGLAAVLTLIFLGMRAVMEIGGACADGGPFVPVRPCPAGVPLLMTVSFPGLFLFAAITIWKGSRLGARYAAVALLLWPALFLSLGWNFLEFAFRPPGDEGGIEAGWLICGVVFVLMGGLPLLAAIPRRKDSSRRASVRVGRALQAAAVRMERSADAAAADAAARAQRSADTPPRRDQDLASQLERLAALHTDGRLTDAEFAAAKAALLGAHADRAAGRPA